MDHNLTELLLPIGVLTTIAAGIGYFIKTLTDYRLKKRLIEKELVNQEVQALFKKEESSRLASLKWGLVVFFGGIGLIIINYVDFYRDSPLPFGIFAVSLSLGFLVYFVAAKNFSE